MRKLNATKIRLHRSHSYTITFSYSASERRKVCSGKVPTKNKWLRRSQTEAEY